MTLVGADNVVIAAAGIVAQYIYNDPSTSVVVAGMVGGLVRWQQKREPWRVGLGSVFIGGACAKYIGPLCLQLVEDALDLKVSDASGKTGGFLMGLLGVMIIKYIFDSAEVRLNSKKEREAQ